MKEKVRNVRVKAVHDMRIERSGGNTVLKLTHNNWDKKEVTHYHITLDSYDLRALAALLWKPVQWLRQEIGEMVSALQKEPPAK